MQDPVFHKLLGGIVNAHRKHAGEGIAKNGLTRGQPMLLDMLVKYDGCNQKLIAEKCQLEPATITSILTLMEKSGLVERRPSPEDKRVMTVHLTQKGRDAHQRVSEVFLREQDDVCFAGFSEQEREEAISVLRRIHRNLTGHDLEF